MISAHDQWSVPAGKGVVSGGHGWRYARPMTYMISIEARVLKPGLCDSGLTGSLTLPVKVVPAFWGKKDIYSFPQPRV